MTDQNQIPSGKEAILGKFYPLLDHGFVKLIDVMGNDAAVVQAARVSYGDGTKKVSEDRGLIRYLVRNKHTSPLEMIEMKFHCKMPIFVARQWVRHRTASLNEISGRYSVLKAEFYKPEIEQIRQQSKVNKQGRDEPVSEGVAQTYLQDLAEHRNMAAEMYSDFLEEGIARELARIDLPLSTYTEWYWKIDLHNLMHFLKLRTDPHAQWEIRVYANVIAAMVKAVAPICYEAWVDYIFGARTFSRLELQVLSKMVRAWSDSDDLEAAMNAGLSTREIDEFKAKLAYDASITPEFKLPEPVEQQP
jgi:thymidylate synthase (FAD)